VVFPGRGDDKGSRAANRTAQGRVNALVSRQRQHSVVTEVSFFTLY